MKDHLPEVTTDERMALQAILRDVQSRLDIANKAAIQGSAGGIRHALTLLSGSVIAAEYQAKRIK